MRWQRKEGSPTLRYNVICCIVMLYVFSISKKKKKTRRRYKGGKKMFIYKTRKVHNTIITATIAIMVRIMSFIRNRKSDRKLKEEKCLFRIKEMKKVVFFSSVKLSVYLRY